MLRVPPAILITILLSVPAPAPGAEPLTGSERQQLLTSPTRHVRGVGEVMAKAIADGVDRSPTFARLLARLNRSDVVVYAESVRDLPSMLAARMLFLRGQGRFRYVRVQVRVDATANERIALLAHELRHALEVADSPDVQDEETLVTMYERIGGPLRTAHHYDTVAARETGRQVRRELVGL